MQAFEVLRVWQLAQELSVRIDELTERRAFARATGLRGQLRRAASSVGGMIAEGAGHRSAAHVAHYLETARASADETRSHLDRARRRAIVSGEEYLALSSECRLLATMLSALIAKVREGTTRPATVPPHRKPTTEN